ncbi:MAG TPA: long-chain fatty acid--CoA ligase [Kofleriaceae bacterium]|nr:long-chain fatty acid--CoA ligase [Kofleriaceae bacterium]
MKHIHTLVELYQWSCAQYADREILGSKQAGAWRWLTYRQFRTMIDDLRSGLAGLGIASGDRVAFIGDNSIEWAVAAYATYGLGAAFVPMYQAQRPGEWQFILGDCGARAVIVANDATYDVLTGMQASLPELRHIIGIARPETAAGSWSALMAAGARQPVPAISPAPQQVAGFIYTSGTTGKPKGVLLSHRNITSNIEAIHQVIQLSPEDRYLSFLPWAHSYGQTVELHMLLSYGASLAINDELPKLLANLAEIKPTVLVAVPRIFNRIYDAVTRDIASRPELIRKIVHHGLEQARKRARGEPLGTLDKMELALDDRMIFHKIRDRFGGRLRYAFTGSAAISKEVIEFIDALGITVYEGYGLTETSPVVTTNSPLGRKFGSVGRPLPGCRVEIDTRVTGEAQRGEIVVYGPNVMLGYHNRPEENAATLMPDGGLRTGDLGYLDEDGYLYISGRVKEQYKLENGKYVMPSSLEERLKLSPFIANLMVHGDGRPFNVALVVPSLPAVQAWADQQGFALPDDPTLDERVRGLIMAEIERLSGEFKGFEKPRAVALVREDFTPGNGLLTPTLKLKRREVLARHQKIIDDLYASLAAGQAAAARPPGPAASPRAVP